MPKPRSDASVSLPLVRVDRAEEAAGEAAVIAEHLLRDDTIERDLMLRIRRVALVLKEHGELRRDLKDQLDYDSLTLLRLNDLEDARHGAVWVRVREISPALDYHGTEPATAA